MAGIVKGNIDPNGIVLIVGVLVLLLLVLLRNRPFILVGRLLRGIWRPLGRALRPVRWIFRPVIWILKLLGIVPRVARGAGQEARNYVGPSAFSALIRAFRWKTETEQELEKTELMARIADLAAAKAFDRSREGATTNLEEAGKVFHENYIQLKTLIDRAFQEADGDIEIARTHFDRLQNSEENATGLTLDVASVKAALEHEERHLEKRGAIFNWLVPGQGFIRNEPFDYADARNNYFLANIFFTYDIPVGTPKSGVKATNLYEDIDGAFSVSMFGIKDRDAFYLLTQMRKVINSNVRKLAVWFSTIVTVFFLLNIYIAGNVPNWLKELLSLDDVGRLAGIELPNKTIFLIVSFFLSAAAMWLLYYAEYAHYVRNNGREMYNFLTRYLAMLNNIYRQAIANARGVFAGEIETRDRADMEAHAQVWFANIQWIGFRAFYIETFLRNTMYQIHRNSGYYVILIPLLFIVGTSLLLLYTGYLSVLGQMFVLSGQSDATTLQSLIFLVTMAILVLMVIFYLTHSLHDLEGSIRESEWFNFHDFELQKTTTNLIGRYGGEIRFWRERLKSGEGRAG